MPKRKLFSLNIDKRTENLQADLEDAEFFEYDKLSDSTKRKDNGYLRRFEEFFVELSRMDTDNYLKQYENDEFDVKTSSNVRLRMTNIMAFAFKPPILAEFCDASDRLSAYPSHHFKICYDKI